MISKRIGLTWVIGMSAMLALSLAGCGLPFNTLSGSGNVVTQQFEFSDFEEVDLSYAFKGTITQGDNYRIVVRVDDNLVNKLVVEKNGNRLRIGFTPNTVVTRGTMEAEITMPRLTWVNASGASQARLIGFSSAEDFTGEASGASRIEGDINTGDLDLEASGASTISLAGTGANLRANASGASTIDLEEFEVADANVDASGASTITVNLTGELDARASGASNVNYLGSPTMGDINTSGGSNIRQR